MKTISEDEAQQLANITGCWVAMDKDGEVYIYKCEPKQAFLMEWRTDDEDEFNPCQLPVTIATDRPWTECLWAPEKGEEHHE
jgi:hypothetical protein